MKMVRIKCTALSTSPNWENLEIKVEGKKPVWIPYSQIDETIRDKETRVCAVIIPEWLAEDRGLV